MRFNSFGHRNYTYKITVPPSKLPIDITTVKNYLKITNNVDDQLIDIMIRAAVDFAEKFTGRDFITRTYETYRDYFPIYYDSSEGYYTNGFFPNNSEINFVGGNKGFEIKRSPLQSVTSIRYLKNNVSTLVDSSIYYNTLENDYSEILTLPNQSWPQDVDSRLQAITITFVTGLGNSADVLPTWIKQGILQHVANVYENRGDCTDTGSFEKFLPFTAKSIYLQNKILRV